MGRAGKDTACEYLASITNLRNAGTCSKYLAKHVAARLGVPVEEAYAKRHENRDLWFRIGNETRERDPAMYVREMMAEGEIGGGIRSEDEYFAARAEGLFDLAVWVDNCRVPDDPTVKVKRHHCDIIIENNGTIYDFYARLFTLARFAGVLKGK